MKSIKDLACEVWLIEFIPESDIPKLQRFHDAAIAQHNESLLAGVGEPYCKAAVLDELFAAKAGIDPEAPLYTADQLAAAVAIEREKTEKFESALEDLMFHVEEAMRNEPQPYEIEKAYERAAAIRGRHDR